MIDEQTLCLASCEAFFFSSEQSPAQSQPSQSFFFFSVSSSDWLHQQMAENQTTLSPTEL